MESLTETRIQQVVDDACRRTQERWEGKTTSPSSSPSPRSVIRFSRISNHWDSIMPLLHDSPNIVTNRLGQVLGILATVDSQCIGFCSFYLAYSTWDGRVIFLDQLQIFHQKAALFLIPEELFAMSLRYTIADIGIKLDCTRFVWQHVADTAPQFPNVRPDTLHDWLTITMDRPAMAQLAKVTSIHSGSSTNKDCFGTTICNCLLEGNDKDQTSKLRLRLATAQDLESIERLVHGLAHFEKMPDAVHVTQEHYLCDGFPTTVEEKEDAHPLFYCILLEDDQSYVCGMAFIYLAHSLRLGRFLYLEDLFMEEAFRGMGGGKVAMETLARICLALDCDTFVWQALDWNTPAIDFYAKIGGKVQEGLLTSRFAGESFKELCNNRPQDC